MSLTNIVYTPVDTGMAKVSKEWDNPNSKNFYLLAGKICLYKVVETGHAPLYLQNAKSDCI